MIANIFGHHGKKVLCKPSYGKWRTRFSSKRFYQFFTSANSRLFRAYFKEFISELFVDTYYAVIFFLGQTNWIVLNSHRLKSVKVKGFIHSWWIFYTLFICFFIHDEFFTLLSSAFLKNAKFVCSVCVVRNKKNQNGSKNSGFWFSNLRCWGEFWNYIM